MVREGRVDLVCSDDLPPVAWSPRFGAVILILGLAVVVVLRAPVGEELRFDDLDGKGREVLLDVLVDPDRVLGFFSSAPVRVGIIAWPRSGFDLSFGEESSTGSCNHKRLTSLS